MRVRSILTVLAACCAVAPAAGAECLGPPGQRVGLALSGGGARGIAHVSVLRTLEQRGVRVGCIAGTSMGAVLGAIYASGVPLERMEALVRSLDWHEIFSASPERELVPLAQRWDLAPAAFRVGFDYWKLRLPQALDSDYRVNRLLAELLAGPGLRAGGDFDRLPIPFRAVAMDLETGEREVLGSGSLERAVRASSAFPARLLPVHHPRGLLVDGGLVDALPTDVVRAMGADIVIAVDVRLPPLPPEDYGDATGVVAKVVEVLMHRRNADFAARADLTIAPPLAGITDVSYDRADAILAGGAQAATRALDARPEALARLVPASAVVGGAQPPDPDVTLWPEGRPLAHVRVEGNGSVREQFVRGVLAVAEGSGLERERVLHGVDALYATRLFDTVWVELQPAGTAIDLTVHVQERPRRVLELGGTFDDADKLGGFVRARNRDLLGGGEDLALTAFGSQGEVGLRATLSGPRLPLMGLLGYYARAEGGDDHPRVFQEGDLLGRAEFERRELAVGLQRALAPAALLRVGLATGRVATQPRPGLPFAEARDTERALEALAVWDALNDPWLPSRGGRVSLQARRSLPGLGATRSYWTAEAALAAALPAGPGVLQAEARGGLSGGDLPLYQQFRIGGPVLMPGFDRAELWGHQALAGAVSYSLDFGPLRVTPRAGAGGVFANRAAISLDALQAGVGLEVAYRTAAGPLAVSWGHSRATGSRFYVSAGRTFRR